MIKNREIDELYFLLFGLYITLIIVAFSIATKLVALPFGLSASVSTVVSYGFSFVVTDLISELYGYKAARRVIRATFICLMITLAMFNLAVYLPPAEGYEGQEAFAQTLGYSPRIVIGALLGYYLSQRIDIWIYHKIKHKTQGKHVWLRNNISTMIAQFVDSVVWISIAFYGVFPNIVELITGEYIVKLSVAVIDTFVIYAVLMFLRNKAHKTISS